MPASQESPAGTASSVLLVEEYDALAAAITSALKKFAPRHRVRAVESLAEAEATVAGNSPQLLIVDFDPPRSDAIEFLEKISAGNPNGRFLAIASGVPPALNGERYGPNAIQFIEKPFELAEFGAAVQALLGPWMNAVSGDSRGTLRDLNVRDLVPLQCLNLATSVLHLKSSGERSGEIHFLDGQIIHAAVGNFTGPGALHQMMRWKNPRASETRRLLDGPRTIHGPWSQVFLEALRKTAASHEEGVPPVPTVVPAIPDPPKKSVKTGKKIVIIDDTEMLLIFVEDTLATADPSLQIVTALTGNEGVRRAEIMNPDLVLLDYSLPDLRGDQVCERLLQGETTLRIPVVMMSGHVSEMAAAARKYPNIVATIAKPFMSEALLTVVTEALSKGPLTPGAPVPHGNGKKPAKKNGASSPAKLAEKHSPPAPPPPEVQLPPPTSTVSKTESEPPFVAQQTPEKLPAPPPAAGRTLAPETAVFPSPGAVCHPGLPSPVFTPRETGTNPPLPMAPPAPAPLPEAPRPSIVPTAPQQEQPVSGATRELAESPAAPMPTPPPTLPAVHTEPLLPDPSALLAEPRPPLTAPGRLAAVNGSSVVLGLGMEVIAVLFTSRFQIGTIRARPTASSLSLTHSSAPAENLLAGFEIGRVELDAHGRIQTMRVVPTRQPAKPVQTRSGFAINDVALVNQTAPIQMTAGSAAPMILQLMAAFKVAGVELTDRFEVAQLVLQPAGSRVRVSLDPQSAAAGGNEFETIQVRLDASRRIAEFVLNPANPQRLL